MPELPDVEIFKRVMDKHGRRPCRRARRGCRPGQPGRRQRGHIAAATEGQAPFRSSRRHGKVLFAVFEDAATLAMHFGTNGSLVGLSPDERRTVRPSG